MSESHQQSFRNMDYIVIEAQVEARVACIKAFDPICNDMPQPEDILDMPG